MASRTCIISLATRNKQYPEALERLCDSLVRVGFRGELLCWRPGEFPDDAPAHRDVPFAFKPYCFEAAKRQHLDLVLWMDAACVAVRPLDQLFRTIAERGYLLFRNSRHAVGEWSSDDALAWFGTTRDDAMRMPEVNAAAVGLDVRSPAGSEFLRQWLQAAQAALPFRGAPASADGENDYLKIKWNQDGRVSADPRVRGHRHDQTVAGILADRLGLELTPHGVQPYSRRRPAISRRSLIIVDRDVSTNPGPLTSLTRINADMKMGYVKHVLTRLRLRRHALR